MGRGVLFFAEHQRRQCECDDLHRDDREHDPKDAPVGRPIGSSAQLGNRTFDDWRPYTGAGVVNRTWMTKAFDDWRPYTGPESSIVDAIGQRLLGLPREPKPPGA